MINDFDSDQEDNRYNNDDLLQHIRKNWMKLDEDWTHLPTSLNNKIDEIIFPSEKLAYLFEVIEVSKYSKDVAYGTIPVMASLYESLIGPKNKVRCAAFVATYTDTAEFRYAALDVLEEHQEACLNTRYRMSALACLLNDDRPNTDDDFTRIEKYKSFQAEWSNLIQKKDDTEIASAAYEVLEPMRLMNVSKAPLLQLIIDYIDQCKDPEMRIDMIMFCNRDFQRKHDDEHYLNAGRDADFFPTHPTFDWEKRFFKSTFEMMKDTGYDSGLEYIYSRYSEFPHNDFVRQSYVLLDMTQDIFKQEESSIFSELLPEPDLTGLPNETKFSKILRNTKSYMNFSCALHQDFMKDGTMVEAQTFHTLRTAYELVKSITDIKEATPHMVATLNSFKRNFLTSFITGEAKFDQEKFIEIDTGVHSRKPAAGYVHVEISKLDMQDDFNDEQINTLDHQQNVLDLTKKFQVETPQTAEDRYKLQAQQFNSLGFFAEPNTRLMKSVSRTYNRNNDQFCEKSWFISGENDEPIAIGFLSLTPILN